MLKRLRKFWSSNACRSRKNCCMENSRRNRQKENQMSSFLRLMILLAAVTVAVAPLMVVAQTQTAAKPWTPPKTPWGDPDIQGLWPGVDMVGTPLERDRSLGTRAFLTEEEFAKKVAFAEEQNEIDTAETVSKNPRIARGGVFITCEQDPNLCRNGV